MTKVIQFPTPDPEKFGFKPVRKKVRPESKRGQLDLFAGGRVVSFNKLSPFEEALMMDEQGDASARELYKKAIEAGDSLADAYCNLGIIESQSHQHNKAIDCFTKSLKEDPRHFESHYNLANLYAELGNYSLAKVHYQVSIEVEPRFPNSYFNLALALVMNREIEESIRALHTYRSLVPPEEQLVAEELIQKLLRTLL